MRKFNHILVIALAVFFSACNNWLDLMPEGQATSEELFKSGDGYRSVLSGVYKAMSVPSLYGVDLQFGMVDCMSRQYTWNWQYQPKDNRYRDAREFKYESTNLRPAIDGLWKDAFNVIANANNLIQNAEQASPELFYGKDVERKMILGEAYACRALMHFDLLRLFAPAMVHVDDDPGNFVPYVETYPEIQANGIAVRPFLEKVERDLLKARELVAEFDTTSLGQTLCASGNVRFYADFNGLFGLEGAADPDVIDDFYKGRGYHLNYYAVTALLARVYQYAGKHQEAYEMATEVMEAKANGVNVSYEMFTKDDFGGITYRDDPEQREDLKVVSNLIFALYNERAYEDNSLGSFFQKRQDGMSEGNWLVFDMEGQEIFKSVDGEDEQESDARRYLIFEAGYHPISAKWYCHEDKLKRDKNVTILPVIRATEMRYIIAEYHARQGNFTEAFNVLNQIRQNRNLWTPIEVKSSLPEFLKYLIKDAQREWMSEGQLFYLYKRLDAPVKLELNETRPLNKSEYRLPIPDDQAM